MRPAVTLQDRALRREVFDRCCNGVGSARDAAPLDDTLFALSLAATQIVVMG
jgi:hypothetical protein